MYLCETLFLFREKSVVKKLKIPLLNIHQISSDLLAQNSYS